MLRSLLDRASTQFRYVTYSQVERDCEELARRLADRFGREKLSEYKFAALPRGGYIVLGILSYLLNLRSSQLTGPYPPDVPLVVTDDCAISGRRFLEFLRGSKSREVTFAPLYSHPGLCSAMEAQESRVVACMRSQDLHDYAPDELRDEYPAWRETWMRNSGENCYWVGRPEHICFPWSEPDTKVWNPVSKQVEVGWRIAPPGLCLKNRAAPGVNPGQIQIQPKAKGPLQPTPQVIFGELEGAVVVAHSGTGEAFSLEGSAADMWRSIIRLGDADTIIGDLQGIYEMDEATLKDDLTAFVNDLKRRSILEEMTR
jgi:hypothetical protein